MIDSATILGATSLILAALVVQRNLWIEDLRDELARVKRERDQC